MLERNSLVEFFYFHLYLFLFSILCSVDPSNFKKLPSNFQTSDFFFIYYLINFPRTMLILIHANKTGKTEANLVIIQVYSNNFVFSRLKLKS